MFSPRDHGRKFTFAGENSTLMKIQGIQLTLLLINLGMLTYLILTSLKPEQSSLPVIKGKSLELVDEKGTKRASIKVEPSGETVLRLHNAKGEVRVKMGASEDGSGLVLLNDSTNPGIQALAKHSGGTLTLFDENGNKHAVKP